MSGFRGVVYTMDELAQKTGADWIIKLDSDSILLTLDFLNSEYDYIGANASFEPKFYARGWCATYTSQTIHELSLFIRDDKNINRIIEAKNNRGYAKPMGEDVFMGIALVDVLGKKSLIGNLHQKMQPSFLFYDSHTLNPNASCVLCKFYNENPSSIIKRMQKAVDLLKYRLSAPKEILSQGQKTILVVTFSYKRDE